MKSPTGQKVNHEMRQALLEEAYDNFLGGRISGKEFNSLIASEIFPDIGGQDCKKFFREYDK